MASVKTPDGRVRRMNRNFGTFTTPAYTTKEPQSPIIDDQGNEVPVPDLVVYHPAITKLVVGWREWKSAADFEAYEAGQEVFSAEDGEDYHGEEIVLPGADWTPNTNSLEPVITQYFAAMSYLSMQKRHPEWQSDES